MTDETTKQGRKELEATMTRLADVLISHGALQKLRKYHEQSPQPEPEADPHQEAPLLDWNEIHQVVTDAIIGHPHQGTDHTGDKDAIGRIAEGVRKAILRDIQSGNDRLRKTDAK